MTDMKEAPRTSQADLSVTTSDGLTHHKFLSKPIIVLIILLLLMGLGSISFVAYELYAPLQTDEVIIRIKQGESTKTIARNLKQNEIIRSAFWFDVMVRITHSDRQLRSGRYVFGGNVSIVQTVKQIKKGSSAYLHLTIPEGFSLFQTCKQMERSGIAPYEKLMQTASDPVLIKKLTGYRYQTLEGFLYPETYAFDIDLAPEQIFTQMTALFFEKLKTANIKITDREQFYKDLILASIVEQEAVQENEKPMIAGVYLHRLKKGMKLESCPTVDYVLERQGIRRKRLLFSDLKVESEYNTYQISGLPPAPICNPSISSLQAVLSPQDTDYLYFFADFQGRNVFSRTFAEHLSKQKQFMKE